MRVSKIGRDTAHLVEALASRRRSTRNISATSVTPPQIRDCSSTSTSPRKRKRATSTDNHVSTVTTVTSSEAPLAESTAKPRKARRQPAKKIKGADGRITFEAPANWVEIYDTTKQMRARWAAPVDTMGCETLADEKRSPRDQRFQTLIALMLSSQTKDTVTSVAMKNLKERLPGGFCLEAMRAVSPQVLNELINKVGFHNNKTKFIKQVADILAQKFNSDIPDTIEGLISLPGVGPKMAYLCMSAAWNRDEGIGVDVHVHRITNLWGWHKTDTPEQTREVLESWLPRDKWHDINTVLVGFGQTWCPPVGRKCGECLLAQKSLCPSAVISNSSPKKVKRETVNVKQEDNDMTISTEEVTILKDQPIKAEDIDPNVSHSTVQDIEDVVSTRRSTSRRVP